MWSIPQDGYNPLVPDARLGPLGTPHAPSLVAGTPGFEEADMFDVAIASALSVAYFLSVVVVVTRTEAPRPAYARVRK